MTDYEHMTDSELRRVIAERLGWTITPEDQIMILRDPDGEPHFAFDRSSHITESQDIDMAWDLLQAFWANGIHAGIPNWPADCNAALAIEADLGLMWIEHRYNAMLKQWSVRLPDTRGVKLAEAYDTVLARAICIAWLRWLDVQVAINHDSE